MPGGGPWPWPCTGPGDGLGPFALAPGKGNGIGPPVGGNWKLGGRPPGKGIFGGGGALVAEKGGKAGFWPP
jgi:hypothetical protein